MSKPVLILFYPSTVPENHPRFSMPYALLYLERAVRNLNIEIVIIDEDITPNFQAVIEKYADRLAFAGVSVMTGRQIMGAMRFSKYVKSNFSNIKTIWGGWHPSVLPEQTLNEDFIDFIIHGQGESPFSELLSALIAETEYSHIKGLGYKEGSHVFINERAPFADFNQYPPINFTLLDLKKYVVAGTIVYFASHGCVYECGFCAMSTMYRKKWFPKAINQIIEDIKLLKEETNFKSINFQDDNFFVNKKFTLLLCEAIIENTLEFEFITSAHARDILRYTDEELLLIFSAGCRKVYIGAESGCQEVLDLINKKETVEDNLEVLKRLKKHSMVTVFSTMIALPLSPEKDLMMTLNMLRLGKLIDEKLEALIFYYTPYPQTPLYEWAKQSGFIPPERLEKWGDYTMFNATLPWHKKYFKRRLENFYNYYFPFYNKNVVHVAPEALKKKAKIFIKLFHLINRWRFRHNFFYFPFEARLMLYFVRKYNRKNKQRFCFSSTWSFYENRFF